MDHSNSSRAPPRRRRAAARSPRASGDGPIQTSSGAVGAERVAQPVASPPCIARQPATSRGANRRISASQRSSSFQSWMLLPSSNGTNIPPAAGRPAEAVAREIQLAHDQRMQQPDDVGAGRHPHAGPRLLQRAGAAHPLARLQHEHPLPGSRQVRGAREPVVPRPDHDRRPTRRAGERPHRLRQTDPAEHGGRSDCLHGARSRGGAMRHAHIAPSPRAPTPATRPARAPPAGTASRAARSRRWPPPTAGSSPRRRTAAPSAASSSPTQ